MPIAAAIAFPLINGRRMSRTSVDLQIAGIQVLTWSAINWSAKLTPGKAPRGSSAEPAGRTLGSAEYTGDVMLSVEEAAVIRAALGNGYMAKDFLIACTAYEPGSGASQTVMTGVRITQEDGSVPEGDDGLQVKWTLDIMRLVQDGLSPVPALPFA